MKKMAIFLGLALVLAGIAVPCAAVEYQAAEVSRAFAQFYVQANGYPGWSNGTLDAGTAFHDLAGNPSCYVFQIQEAGEYRGYVTIMARSDYEPFLEMSEGQSPVRQAEAIGPGVALDYLYLGQLNYFATYPDPASGEVVVHIPSGWRTNRAELAAMADRYASREPERAAAAQAYWDRYLAAPNALPTPDEASASGVTDAFTIPGMAEPLRDAFKWYRGCGPTSEAMVLSYYGRNGYPPGTGIYSGLAEQAAWFCWDGTEPVVLPFACGTNPSCTEECVKAPRNLADELADYHHIPPDGATGGPMGIKWSALPWVADDAIEDIAQGHGVTLEATWDIWTSDSLMTEEINAERPVLIVFYWNQGDYAWHWSVIVGYDFTGGKRVAILYNTWEERVKTLNLRNYLYDYVRVKPGRSPKPPTPLLVARSRSREVALTWNTSLDSSVQSYDIYRAMPGSMFTKIASNVIGRGYVDLDLTNGTQYSYTVQALSSTAMSQLSDPAGAKPGLMPPTAATLSWRTRTSNIEYTLAWAPDLSAGIAPTGYNVYRTNNDDFDPLWSIPINEESGPLRSATFHDTVQKHQPSDPTRKYIITAVDAIGNESQGAEIVLDALHPGKPTNLTRAGTDDRGIHFSWRAPVTNADDTPLSDLKGYELYYGAVNSGNSYDGTGATQGASPIFVPASGLSMEYALSGLKSNTVYYVAVTAIDIYGNESEYSNEIIVAQNNPTEPINFLAWWNATDHSNVLSWQAPEDPVGILRYDIERSTGGEYQSLGSVDASLGFSSGTCNQSRKIENNVYRYIDRDGSNGCQGLEPGQTYRYRVYSVDLAGNVSLVYSEAEVHSGPADYAIMVSRSTIHNGFPTGLTTRSYSDTVKDYLKFLVAKIPDDSTVSILEFREQVYSWSVLAPASTITGKQVGSSGVLLDNRNQVLAAADLFQPKDTWYLDYGEVLNGTNGDISWRDSVLYPWGESDALTLLKGGPNTRKIGIIITDWYDSHVLGYSQVYDYWASSIGTFVGAGNDLKNAILVPASSALHDGAQYVQGLLGRSDVVNMIGADDIKIVRYDAKTKFDTDTASALVGCKESLLNETYQVNPGEQHELSLNIDGTVSNLSLLLTGKGLTHRLFRPDGTLVALQTTGGELSSVDPAVAYERLAGSGSDVFHLINPEAGAWRIEADGGALGSKIWGRTVAFGETDTKLKAGVPSQVRPGEKFTVSALMSGGGSFVGTPSLTLRLTRPGSVYALGSTVRETGITGQQIAGGLIRYDGEYVVVDYEGRYPYSLLFNQTDNGGQRVFREASGEFFVQGDAPVFASPDPVEEIVEESPSISVLVADDVAVQNYSMRVDGRLVSVIAEDVVPATASSRFTAPSADWQPRQVKKLTGTVSWVLSPGEHSVEVTAADTIAQAAAPESWTFRVGSGLLATDVAGDDYGPGYYSYPTNPALMPRGALDLEGFRVYRDGSLVSFTIDLKNYSSTSGPPTLATLPMVVDVYLDTDGLSGSGRTDLLAGRNALLRTQDAWEYCLTISRDGAKLITAAGGETPVTASFNSGTWTLP